MTEQKEQESEQNKLLIKNTIKQLTKRGITLLEIAAILSLPEKEIRRLSK